MTRLSQIIFGDWWRCCYKDCKGILQFKNEITGRKLCVFENLCLAKRQTHESILTIMASYLSNDLFIPSEKRFRKPSNILANVKDVVLVKFAADKGGGAWKCSLNAVNVKCPQSLRHVRPICEYAADDSRDNMRAAVFYKGSPYRADMEEVLHRRAVVLHIQVGDCSEVGLVVNTSRQHHRKRPTSLPNTCRVHLYQGCDVTNEENHFDRRVARVYFSVLRCILLTRLQKNLIR